MIAAVASAGGPQPGTPAAGTLSYAQAHAGQLHVAAVLTFGAVAPLAIWAATIYRRLRTLGVTAPGAVIGLAGGILAAASIALAPRPLAWAGEPTPGGGRDSVMAWQ